MGNNCKITGKHPPAQQDIRYPPQPFLLSVTPANRRILLILHNNLPNEPLHRLPCQFSGFLLQLCQPFLLLSNGFCVSCSPSIHLDFTFQYPGFPFHLVLPIPSEAHESLSNSTFLKSPVILSPYIGPQTLISHGPVLSAPSAESPGACCI